MARVHQTPNLIGFSCVSGSSILVGSAFYTGNALASVIGLVVLFATLLHWILAARSIKGFEISVSPLIDRARAGETFPFEARIANRSKFLPLQTPNFTIEESGRRKTYRIRLPKTLGPGEEATLIIYPSFMRRGEQTLSVNEARSRFPFRLSKATIQINNRSQGVLIWPEAIRLNPAIFSKLEKSAIRHPIPGGASVNELVDPNNFRDYRAGDPKRLINWRLSAKANQLMIAENRIGSFPAFYFAVSTHPKYWPNPVDFENMVRLLSTLIEESHARQRLGGIVLNNQRLPVRSKSDVESALDRLSSLKLEQSAPVSHSGIRRGDFVLQQIRGSLAVADWRGNIVAK